MLLLFAMLVADQATTVATPAPTLAAKPAASEVKKPKQICEMVEITGSHSRQRVCRGEDEDMDVALLPGV